MLMAKVIAKNLLNKYSTLLYPFEKREMPEKYRGRFVFNADNCIMCKICALKCPTQCITIDPEKGIWEQDAMNCVHCAVCVEACPTHCLTMSKEYRTPYIKRMTLTFQAKPKVKKKKANATEEKNAVEQNTTEE